jgi:hypothetical protein
MTAPRTAPRKTQEPPKGLSIQLAADLHMASRLYAVQRGLTWDALVARALKREIASGDVDDVIDALAKGGM